MTNKIYKSFLLFLAVLSITSAVAYGQAAQPARSASPRNPFYAMDTAFERPGFTTEQQLDLVKELGYAGIAWHEQESPQMLKTLVACEKRGLKMFTIYCAAKIDEQGRIAWSPEMPKLLDALDGHGTIVWLHIGGRGPAFDQLKSDSPPVVKLRKLAESAAAHHLRVALYPHFGEWTAHFGDAARLAQLVHHPQFGVTFNLCHAFAVGDEKQIPALLEASKPVLSTVTICGADADVKGAAWARLIRPLGSGTYDVNIVLRALGKIDFHGPVGFQGYAIPGDARSILAPTMKTWRNLQEK